MCVSILKPIVRRIHSTLAVKQPLDTMPVPMLDAPPIKTLEAMGFMTVGRLDPESVTLVRPRLSGQIEDVILCRKNTKIGMWVLRLGVRWFDADLVATQVYKEVTQPWPLIDGMTYSRSSVPWLRTERGFQISGRYKRARDDLTDPTLAAALARQPDPDRLCDYDLAEMDKRVAEVFDERFGRPETIEEFYKFCASAAGEPSLQLSNAAALIAMYLYLAHALGLPKLPLPGQLERLATGQLPSHLSPQAYVQRCITWLEGRRYS